MAASASGESWAVLAASEMGKGVWLKGWLKSTRPDRLIIWDRNDEYQDHADQVVNLADLARACMAPGFRVRYVPRAAAGKMLRAEFERWCLIAMQCKGGTVIVEELADVTTASYAPPAWQQLNTRGRHHHGLHIIGLSQSPAWVDKRFLGNTTFLHVGYLGTAAHRKAVAEEIDVTADEIKALPQFAYIEYRRSTKQLTRGRVKLPARRGR